MEYKNYDEAAKLLGLDMEEYTKAKELFLKDKTLAIKELLGYEDEEIQEFKDFWYYYLSEFSNCFFHNFGTKGYTETIKRYLSKNNFEMEDINFEEFSNIEFRYNEALFDILLSEVRYSLKDKSLDVFGINVGFDSSIYYILPKETLNVLNKMTKDFAVFDFQKLEEVYGEIYKITKEIPNIPSLKVGDYIEKAKDEEGVYKTLFSMTAFNNFYMKNIPSESLELVL